MGNITFTDQTLGYISLFENLTKTRIKDCLEFSDTVYFIVHEGQLQYAVGKNGSKVKRLRMLLKKNIKIIEHSNNLEKFIKNIFHDFAIKNIKIEDSADGKSKKAFVSVNLQDKGKIIGRDSRNLKIAHEIINRHENIDILII
ncbi:NusA-like transcription termination signal-binding factor [[Eubacterium] cellulosolvens]